jgi:lysozyme
LENTLNTWIRGIDVSHFQGAIDWSQVAGDGVVFCFIKATQGTSYVDPCFQQNWASSAASGLWQGAYHFGQASQDPIAQAQHFFNTVGTLGPNTLPPVLDLEILDGMGASETLSWALSFLSETDALFGCATVLYTDPGFWQALQNLPGCAVLSSRPLWLADYAAQPRVPAPWRAWTFWQYSDGSLNGGSPVAGVNGAVDQDWFAGSLSDLGALR